MTSNELYHHGIKGMKWGVRRYQNSNGSYTAAGKKRYADGSGSHTENTKSNNISGKQTGNKRTRKNSKKGERIFNALKKGANDALDKAENDNFFKSDSMFSESYMKRKSQIDRAREAINSLDYKTLKSRNGKKHLINTGKTALNGYLDDADDRDFFNKDWDTRMENEQRRDAIRKILR